MILASSNSIAKAWCCFGIVASVAWCGSLPNRETPAQNLAIVSPAGDIEMAGGDNGIGVVEFKSHCASAQLSVLPRFQNAHEVVLNGQALGQKEAKLLASLPHLTALQLKGCFIADEAWALISKIRLSELDISSTNVTGGLLQKETPKTVKRLFVADLGLKSGDLQFLAHVPNLEFLDASDNRIDSDSRVTFSKCQNLKTLVLKGTNIDSRFFSPGTWPETLEYVDVQDTRVGALDATSSDQMRQLGVYVADQKSQAASFEMDLVTVADVELAMADTDVVASRVRELRFACEFNKDCTSILNRYPNLQAIDLPSGKISEDFVASMVSKVHLRKLSLCDTRLEGGALHRFGKLKPSEVSLNWAENASQVLNSMDVSLLKRLEAEQCGLVDSDLAFLSRASKLTHLDLRNNELEGDSGEYFSHLGHLVELDIGGNVLNDVFFEKWTPGGELKRLILDGNEGLTVPRRIIRIPSLQIDQ